MLPASSGEERSIKDCEHATLCTYQFSANFITSIIKVTENKTIRSKKIMINAVINQVLWLYTVQLPSHTFQDDMSVLQCLLLVENRTQETIN